MTYVNPAEGIEKPGLSVVTACVLAPTIPRPARQMILKSWDGHMRSGDPFTVRRSAWMLTVAMRALPSRDPFALSGGTQDPYEGLNASNLLHWGEPERFQFVDRWNGLPEAARFLLHETGSVVRIERALRTLPVAERPVAWFDAMAGMWHRLGTFYGIPVGTFLMGTADVDRVRSIRELTTNTASVVARTLRPPDAMVPVVTRFTPSYPPRVEPPSPDGGEPPF